MISKLKDKMIPRKIEKEALHSRILQIENK